MNQQVLSDLVEVAGKKLLNTMDALNQATIRESDAKIGIKNAQADATMLAEWPDLKNDKTRDGFVRSNYPDAFQELDDATRELAAVKLLHDKAELEISLVRLQVQIWSPYMPFSLGGA